MNKSVALSVVGALASVATSGQPSEWLVQDGAALAAVALDDAKPQLRYTFRAERRGAFIGEHSGDATAWIEVAARDARHVITAELRSLTHPEVMPSSLSVPANELDRSRLLAVDAWLACHEDPCVEEFELTISRDAASTLPAVSVQVSLFAFVAGDGPEPSGTSLTVTTKGPL